ncbi:hypothetical protein [Acinetobacter sp. SFB]|uniref:hypothetical protein n=1 Tax=Acinetobacter sp. SFB TaxID=1805634 RepID=UPI0012DFA6C6|nr:hypothetical protein [Acinetobacter sp. SFB]
MPSLCVGVRATAADDWNYGPAPLNIPDDKALGLIEHYLERDIDVSFSYRAG